MIRFEIATRDDAKALTEVSTRTFDDDSRQHGLGPRGGPPGYDSVEWQIKIIGFGRYYKILADEMIIGGLIAFPMGKAHYELGRIFIAPEFQNQGIGAQAIRFIEQRYPAAKKWSLDTPGWALRNQHFYEKMGYVKVGETSPEKDGEGFSSILYQKNVGGQTAQPPAG
jgi:GNAT superfamily N-acetyltransferase